MLFHTETQRFEVNLLDPETHPGAYRLGNKNSIFLHENKVSISLASLYQKKYRNGGRGPSYWLPESGAGIRLVNGRYYPYAFRYDKSRNRVFGLPTWHIGGQSLKQFSPEFLDAYSNALSTLGINSFYDMFPVLRDTESTVEDIGLGAMWAWKYPSFEALVKDKCPLPVESVPETAQSINLIGNTPKSLDKEIYQRCLDLVNRSRTKSLLRLSGLKYAGSALFRSDIASVSKLTDEDLRRLFVVAPYYPAAVPGRPRFKVKVTDSVAEYVRIKE